MIVEAAVDLVPENAEALARFRRLFQTARFRRVAKLGGQITDTDLATLDRLMTTIGAACAQRGMSPAKDPPPLARDAAAEVVDRVLDALEESGFSYVEWLKGQLEDALGEREGQA